jgi:hypothetical protein
MVVILGVDNSYIGGGVLIDANTVLTVAHKVNNVGYNSNLSTIKCIKTILIESK